MPATNPTARIFCRAGELAGHTYELDGESAIGSAADNQIVLGSPLISRRHARIYPKGGTFWLEDLGSTNGTRLDGMTIDHPVPLDRLHIITFSETIDFVFVMAEGDRAHDDPQVPSESTTPPSPTQHVEHGTIIDVGVFSALPELSGAPPPGVSRGETADPAKPASSGKSATPPPPKSPVEGGTIMGMEAFDALPDMRPPSPTIGSGDPSAGEGATPARTPPPRGSRPEDPPSPPPREPSGPGTVAMDFEALAALPDLPAPERASRRPSLHLSVTLPDAGLTHFALKAGENTIGRSPDCDIVITGDPFISRRHAIIEEREGRVVVRDLGGENGTWIGDRKIDEESLEPGDSFRLGPNVELTMEFR